jgi:hypothetical protein
MLHPGTTLRFVAVALSLALGGLAVGCGGKQGSAEAPGSSVGDASSPGDGGAQGSTPAPRPFASTPLEAQSLIQEQIDAHMKTLWKCVGDYRTKKGDPHKAVVVDVGIDQEGTLLGVMSPNSKQELDATLRDCIFATLHGLPFPRSHSGVITVRQTFTDVAMSP